MAEEDGDSRTSSDADCYLTTGSSVMWKEGDRSWWEGPDRNGSLFCQWARRGRG